MIKFKRIKKTIVTLLVMVLLISSSSMQALAASEHRYEVIPEITQEEFEKALEEAIQMEVAKVKDEKEANILKVELKKALSSASQVTPSSFDHGGGIGGSDLLLQPSDTWVPNINVSNDAVAATINTIINATLISLGVGSVAVAINKYGVTQLARLFTANLQSRIIGKVAIALGLSLPLIADWMMNYLNPGLYIAKKLDASDAIPNNGNLNVIW